MSYPPPIYPPPTSHFHTVPVSPQEQSCNAENQREDARGTANDNNVVFDIGDNTTTTQTCTDYWAAFVSTEAASRSLSRYEPNEACPGGPELLLPTPNGEVTEPRDTFATFNEKDDLVGITTIAHPLAQCPIMPSCEEISKQDSSSDATTFTPYTQNNSQDESVVDPSSTSFAPTQNRDAPPHGVTSTTPEPWPTWPCLGSPPQTFTYTRTGEKTASPGTVLPPSPLGDGDRLHMGSAQNDPLGVLDQTITAALCNNLEPRLPTFPKVDAPLLLMSPQPLRSTVKFGLFHYSPHDSPPPSPPSLPPSSPPSLFCSSPAAQWEHLTPPSSSPTNVGDCKEATPLGCDQISKANPSTLVPQPTVPPTKKRAYSSTSDGTPSFTVDGDPSRSNEGTGVKRMRPVPKVTTIGPNKPTPTFHKEQHTKLISPFRSPCLLKHEHHEHPPRAVSVQPQRVAIIHSTGGGFGGKRGSVPPSGDFTPGAAKPFKSPVLSRQPDRPMVKAPSTTFLEPNVQALAAQVQKLRQALKIRQNAVNQDNLEDLVEKWTQAGRDIAWEVWGFARSNEVETSASGWGHSDPTAPAMVSDNDWRGSRESTPEDVGVPARHTLGTMLRYLGIAPETLGWDDEEGDFTGI